MATSKPQEKITVLRRVAIYEEAVFDSLEEFERWKKLMLWENNYKGEEKYEKFYKTNKEKFANVQYNMEDHERTAYIAIKGDVRDCSDDWIHQDIFEEAVDDDNFESMPLLDGTWQDLLLESVLLVGLV